MKGFRPLTAAAALAVASGGAAAPALTPATPASAQPSCAGTALVTGLYNNTRVSIRVPTTANGVRNMNCDLGIGNAGPAVARVQIAMDYCNRLFFSQFPALAVDSDYGPLTARAIKAFQSSFSISSSGIYGPETGHLMKWPVAGTNNTHCAFWQSSG
jgi:peptidoglycan hydrolase-like protein with peptidoglycan-binding domain